MRARERRRTGEEGRDEKGEGTERTTLRTPSQIPGYATGWVQHTGKCTS